MLSSNMHVRLATTVSFVHALASVSLGVSEVRSLQCLKKILASREFLLS